jgi:iron complex outermembrane receptor protein
MNDLSLKINNRFILSWHVWAQHQQREIPPAIFEASSVKMETTTAYRTLVKLEQHRYQSYSSTTTLGVFYEQYAYDDSLIQVRSQASVTNIPFIEQFNLILPRRQKVSLQLIANRSFLTGHTNYSLNKAGVIASYSVDQLLKHINLQTSIEKEVTDVFQVPLIANVSLNWDAWHFIKPYVTVSSHYRMPTLNELYYNPGGNINLKPETSKNLEGGFQLNKKWQTQTLHTDLTLFNRKVNNWIAWYGASILTPHNIQQVWSRGLEFIGHYDINLASRRQNDYP